MGYPLAFWILAWVSILLVFIRYAAFSVSDLRSGIYFYFQSVCCIIDQWSCNLIYLFYHSMTAASWSSRLESNFKCFWVSGGCERKKKCLILSCVLNETRLLFNRSKPFLVKYELTVGRLGFTLQHFYLLTSSNIIFSESPLVDFFFFFFFTYELFWSKLFLKMDFFSFHYF